MKTLKLPDISDNDWPKQIPDKLEDLKPAKRIRNFQMEKLIANYSGNYKKKIVKGRTFIVAPMTMIVPGVLNGSQGPLYYPEEEIQSVVNEWEGIYVTYGHPEESAKGNVDVFNEAGLGFVKNVRWTGNKLVAEAWLDESRCNAIDPGIIANVEIGNPIELSTGLGVTIEKESGRFNGKVYSGIAKNHKPDHLAILMDRPGACSLQDGCGVLNECSLETVKDILKTKIQEKLSSSTGVFSDEKKIGNPYVYIVDLFETYVIYEFKGKYYKQGYTKEGDDIQLSDKDPVIVVKESTYKVVNKDSCDCDDCSKGKACPCDMKKIKNALLLSYKIYNGGKGSGNFGHCGSEGKRGGSRPASECGGGSSSGSKSKKKPGTRTQEPTEDNPYGLSKDDPNYDAYTGPMEPLDMPEEDGGRSGSIKSSTAAKALDKAMAKKSKKSVVKRNMSL